MHEGWRWGAEMTKVTSDPLGRIGILSLLGGGRRRFAIPGVPTSVLIRSCSGSKLASRSCWGPPPSRTGSCDLTLLFPQSRVAHTLHVNVFSQPLARWGRRSWFLVPTCSPPVPGVPPCRDAGTGACRSGGLCLLSRARSTSCPSTLCFAKWGVPFVRGHWQEPRNAKYLQVSFSQNAS